MTVMTERVQRLLEYLKIDPESDALLEALNEALLAPAERLSLVAHGDGAAIRPWAAITDPAVAELWALPFAAQWTGGRLPTRLASETDPEYTERARAEALSPRGMHRGSAAALKVAAETRLTGTRSVRIVQLLGGDVWAVGVLVKASEAPDPAALEAAVNDDEVITGGMKAEVIYSDQPLWQEATRTWSAVDIAVTASNVTLADVT